MWSSVLFPFHATLISHFVLQASFLLFEGRYAEAVLSSERLIGEELDGDVFVWGAEQGAERK